MGGRIGVASRVGKGSTFWVELPLDSAGGTAPAGAGAGPPATAGAEPPTAEVEVSGPADESLLGTAPPSRRGDGERAGRRGRSGGRRALRVSRRPGSSSARPPGGYLPGSVPAWAMVATVSTRPTKMPSTSVPAAVTSRTALPARPVRGHSYAGASSLDAGT